MTSLPRLYFDHKTIATQILQVLLQKIEASSGKLCSCCPAEECCWSHKPPQWPINRNCSLNLPRHHPCQSRRPGWRPFSFSKGLKSTPAISAPFQRTLSLKGLTCIYCYNGTRMVFDGVISGALAECVGLSSATQLIVLHQSWGSFTGALLRELLTQYQRVLTHMFAPCLRQIYLCINERILQK